MPEPTLDFLSQLARPGTPLYRILDRRRRNATGGATVPQQPYRYTGTNGGQGAGGSNVGVRRGDPQMGGFPNGGGVHLSPGLNLSPTVRFGRAVSMVNGHDLSSTKTDSVGVRGPY